MSRILNGNVAFLLCAFLLNSSNFAAQGCQAQNIQNCATADHRSCRVTRAKNDRPSYLAVACAENRLRILRQHRRPLDNPLTQSTWQLPCASGQAKTQERVETREIVPCLKVTVEGDNNDRVGEISTLNLTIVNQCEVPLHNLSAKATLDGSGLEIADRSSPVTFGPMTTPLEFGESKTIQLSIRLREAGSHTLRVEVHADGGYTASIRKVINCR